QFFELSKDDRLKLLQEAAKRVQASGTVVEKKRFESLIKKADITSLNDAKSILRVLSKYLNTEEKAALIASSKMSVRAGGITEAEVDELIQEVESDLEDETKTPEEIANSQADLQELKTLRQLFVQDERKIRAAKPIDMGKIERAIGPYAVSRGFWY